MKFKMTGKNKLNRRGFVHLAALGTGSICLLPGCIKSTFQWRFFTDSEAQLMDALADQIIPPDEWPGGREAGVTNFIDKQLDTYYRKHQLAYREGLAAFEKTIFQVKGKKFEELPFAEQTAMLEKMEVGEFSGDYWKDHSPANFFDMVRQHSLQSFYGSPVHGGNRGYISYHMLGLDYPNVIGQNRYKDLSWRKYNPKSLENGK